MGTTQTKFATKVAQFVRKASLLAQWEMALHGN